MSERSDLEHARQMAAVHQARAQLRSLSREERDAHDRMAAWYEHDARKLQEQALRPTAVRR